MKTGRLTTPPLGGVWKVTDHGNRPLDFFPSPDGCSCNIFWLYVKRRVLRSLSMEKFLSELKRGWLNVWLIVWLGLSLAAPTTTCQTIPRHGLHKDARPRLHCVSRGLLQCHSSRITKVYDCQLSYIWWALQHVSSLVHLGSTVVCHDSCTTICTGLTFLNVFKSKNGVAVHRCLHCKAPKYLTDCCTPVSEIASR